MNNSLHLPVPFNWTCLFSCVPPGGELLPRDESDCCRPAHVPEWGRCLLGFVAASHRQQTCHAWWVRRLTGKKESWLMFRLIKTVTIKKLCMGQDNLLWGEILLNFFILCLLYFHHHTLFIVCWLVLYSVLGFFIPGFPKLQRFQTHHELILSKMLPKLKKHLVSYVTAAWLMLSIHARCTKPQ